MPLAKSSSLINTVKSSLYHLLDMPMANATEPEEGLHRSLDRDRSPLVVLVVLAQACLRRDVLPARRIRQVRRRLMHRAAENL